MTLEEFPKVAIISRDFQVYFKETIQYPYHANNGLKISKIRIFKNSKVGADCLLFTLHTF